MYDMVEKITKPYNLPKQWCDIQGILPLLDANDNESVENIIKDAIKITLFEYDIKNHITPRKDLSTQQKYDLLKSFNINTAFDADSYLGDIEVHIPLDDHLAKFLKDYAQEYKMSSGQAFIMFYHRGRQYCERYKIIAHLFP